MRRFIIGEREGKYGAWLSRPGVDVTSATSKDLLISPDDRNYQFIARGSVAVPVYSSATVFFPSRLSSAPAILFSAILGSSYYYPQLFLHSASTGLGDRFRVHTFDDRFVIYNTPNPNSGAANNLTLRYLVIGVGN